MRKKLKQVTPRMPLSLSFTSPARFAAGPLLSCPRARKLSPISFCFLNMSSKRFTLTLRNSDRTGQNNSSSKTSAWTTSLSTPACAWSLSRPIVLILCRRGSLPRRQPLRVLRGTSSRKWSNRAIITTCPSWSPQWAETKELSLLRSLTPTLSI